MLLFKVVGGVVLVGSLFYMILREASIVGWHTPTRTYEMAFRYGYEWALFLCLSGFILIFIPELCRLYKWLYEWWVSK